MYVCINSLHEKCIYIYIYIYIIYIYIYIYIYIRVYYIQTMCYSFSVN